MEIDLSRPIHSKWSENYTDFSYIFWSRRTSRIKFTKFYREPRQSTPKIVQPGGKILHYSSLPAKPKILITRREDAALDFQSGNIREMHCGHFARKPTHVGVVPVKYINNPKGRCVTPGK
jgi:hypothetical protein